MRGWILVAIDVRKAFLKGISYEQLAELSGEPKREVNFELDARSVHVLRRFPGYETFNPQTEILHNLRPGAGTVDAPRCFGIKLDWATNDEFGALSCTHDPQLIVRHDDKSKDLGFIGCKHVDDIKAACEPWVLKAFIAALAKVFGKGEQEITMNSFACCGITYTLTEHGYDMDQIKYVSALKPITDLEIIGEPEQDLAVPYIAKLFLSLLMALAYALQTGIDIYVFCIALQRHLQQPTYGHVGKLNTLVRWVQKHPAKLTYRKMRCQRKLEIHSDAGFRREVSEDGEVDGKSIRGINVFRVGQAIGTMILVHLIDVLVGFVKVVVRSTFTSEAHGVIGAFGLGIV